MKFKTINPATGEVLKEYTLMKKEEVFTIAEKCNAAQAIWKKKSLKERAADMVKLAAVLRRNKEKYAAVITEEMGKPMKDAAAEIEKCAWTAEVYAKHAEKWLEEEAVEADGIKHRVIFQPLGIIVAVMPWNFPFWQALRFGIPALLAGNTGMLKHASATTGTALAVESTFKEAGFPENVFRTIIADHNTIAELVAHPLIKGVSLTGSTPAGKKIAAIAGQHLKKVVLELGGSDPFIVCEDVDIEFAAMNAVKGRFQNCGQSCIAAKRFIVHEKIADAFSRRLAELAGKLVVGNPHDTNTTMGPLMNENAAKNIEMQVREAVTEGAKVLTGGKKMPGAFYPPTVLANITKEMKVVNEEVFGPVAPVIVVKSDDEAVEIANNTPFGLGGSVWTKDLKRGERIARQIEAGSVFVNSIVKSDPRMPFGGTKESGLGRELSHWGLREFVNIKGLSVYKHE